MLEKWEVLVPGHVARSMHTSQVLRPCDQRGACIAGKEQCNSAAKTLCGKWRNWQKELS